MNVTLHPHRDSPAPAVRGLTAVVTRTVNGVSLRYELRGDLAALVIPELLAPVRADELWKHTCFELFIRRDDGVGYVEFNMAPTGHWAAYGFAKRRSGMHNLAEVQGIPVGSLMMGDTYVLKADVDLTGVAGLPESDWDCAVTTVVEAADGKRSYWSMKHPEGNADFHHPDGFVLKLPKPETV